MSDLGLDAVAEYIETLMLDECLVYREGRKEDAIVANRDEATGLYTPERTGNPAVVYDGKCFFYTKRPDGEPNAVGGGTVLRMQTYASLPLEADWPPLPGDILLVVDVNPEGDQSMIGREYRVEVSDQGTYMVTREVSLFDYSAPEHT